MKKLVKISNRWLAKDVSVLDDSESKILRVDSDKENFSLTKVNEVIRKVFSNPSEEEVSQVNQLVSSKIPVGATVVAGEIDLTSNSGIIFYSQGSKTFSIKIEP